MALATQTAPRRTARKHAPQKKRRPAARTRKRNLLLRYWWVWAVPLTAGLTVVGAMAHAYQELPLNLAIRQDETTFLYDADGNLLTTFNAGVDRRAIGLNQMPPVLRKAVLAAEDAGFYHHGGVSVGAILRAAWANLTGGGIEQGGSTISQQYVRNALPEVGRERTVVRKMKEVLLAIKAERELTKNEILARYLNTIYLGQGAYGVEAAARTYFRVPARKLNLLQSASLAAIISGPELYNPVDNPEDAKSRRNYVLSRMASLGLIDEERVDGLLDRPVKVANAPRGYERKPAAHFIDYTRRYLEREYGGDTFTGGMKVRGTLEPDWQEAAETAIENRLSLDPGTPQAALAAVDVNTGEIRAMVGGKSFVRDQTNLATGDGGTGRQAGSAFKPFTLMAAIEEGIALSSTFAGPSPIDMSKEGCGDWKPENAGGGSYGTMDLISATRSSVNTIFAQLVVEVGPEKVADVARRMGIKSTLELPGGGVPCSITLGSMEVSPLEMAGAYATFASGGVYRPPVPVHVVRDSDGEVLQRNRGKGREVVEENDAWQAVYAMEGVFSATASGAHPGVDAFGKTGTSQDGADVWFCGASTEVAACVWVGHPEGRVAMPGASGGGVAAPIWRDFMVAVHQGLTAGDFPQPEFTGEPIQGTVTPAPAPSPQPTVEEEEPEPEPTREKPSPKPSPKPTKPPTPPSPTPSPDRDRDRDRN